MKYDFAALRFTEDKNLADNLYWYLAELPLKEGERVLAPVGQHNRLQAALVERTLSAEEKDAPYDIRLIKGVAARYGERKLVLGNCEFIEFGGVRYDEKHYTPFGRLLLAKEVPDDLYEASVYGVTKVLTLPASDPKLYEEIAHTTGGVLLVGEEGKAAFEVLYALLIGAKTDFGVAIGEETAALLQEKLL